MLPYYFKLSWLSVKRTPILTALMVVAIGLGIGVNMTVLTVNYMMDKDPIPSKSHQLFHVQLYSYGKGHSNTQTSDGFDYQLTYQDAMNIHRSTIPLRKTRSLATGFSVIPESKDMPPFLESARAVDSDFFSMFDIPFLFGSAWDKGVDVNAKNFVVLGKSMNDRVFKGVNSVGKHINLNSVMYTVAGVIDEWQPAPRYYDLNTGSFNESETIFVPFSLLPIHEFPSWGNKRGWLTETIDTYQDELASETMWNQYWVEFESDETKAQYMEWLRGYIKEQQKIGRFQHEKADASLKNVIEWMKTNKVVSSDNSILVGLSFMFLAVCMINTVGLLLAKFLKRAPEVGVRRALGASRKQIFIQHIVDVTVIGLAGGFLGLCLGKLGLLGVKNLYSSYSQLVYMDTTLIVLAIIIALGSSVLAGMYPAWLICRTNPSVYLKVQ